MPQRPEVLEQAPLKDPLQPHLKGTARSWWLIIVPPNSRDKAPGRVASKESTKPQPDLHTVCRPEDKPPSGPEAEDSSFPTMSGPDLCTFISTQPLTSSPSLLPRKDNSLIRTSQSLEKGGFPGGPDSKESVCNAGDLSSIPGLGRPPQGREWLLTPVFLPGESHGQRSLVGYSPWGRRELDMTEWLTLSLSGEGGYLFDCLICHRKPQPTQRSKDPLVPSLGNFTGALDAAVCPDCSLGQCGTARKLSPPKCIPCFNMTRLCNGKTRSSEYLHGKF